MRSEHHGATDWTNGGAAGATPLLTDAEAALHEIQDIVGRKWHPVLLYHLLRDGPLGFSALKSRVDGISSKMLSEGLSDLEDADLVSRELLSDQPVRVEYRLTERGSALEGVITGMVRWGSEHAEADA
jgi:DNA-binding HxlR family transcriptional regulator